MFKHALSDDEHTVLHGSVLSAQLPPLRHGFGLQPCLMLQVGPVQPSGHATVVVSEVVRVDVVVVASVVVLTIVAQVRPAYP